MQINHELIALVGYVSNRALCLLHLPLLSSFGQNQHPMEDLLVVTRCFGS